VKVNNLELYFNSYPVALKNGSLINIGDESYYFLLPRNVIKKKRVVDDLRQ